jgi:hypothetical protein
MSSVEVPPGECRQCYTHAYDKSIHRSQDQSTDCPGCADHMVNGHPPQMIVPGKSRSWW